MKKNYSLFKRSVLLGSALFAFSFASLGQVVSYTFNYTGSVQTFTVPLCVTSITVDARGAQGGNSISNYGTGGMGGRVQCAYAVTPGQVLSIYVGGAGGLTTAGYNGGGSCGSSYPAGGGGASDIRTGGTALSNRIIIAGGGGGAAYYCGSGMDGGHGGGSTGANGYYCGTQSTNSGYGGSQTAGGISNGGSGTAGTLGTGGTGYSIYGGGGGGGYYGGGGGTYGGGGGGSSYVASGGSNITSTQGYQTGNGQIVLLVGSTATVQAVASPTIVCANASVNLVASNVVTYTWLPVQTFTGSNSASIVHSPSASVVYTVVGTNSLGCTSTKTISVPVQTAVPVLSVANPSANICPGRTTSLTASGATTYTWAGSQSITNGVAFVPSGNGSFTVTGQNACGTSTMSTSISILSNPTVVTSVSPSTLCTGQQLTLTASGGTNHVWSSGFPNGTGFYPNTTLAYTVIVTAANGCTAQAVTAPVTVVQTPTQFPIANPALICIGSTATISATSASGYTWTSPGGGNTLTAQVVVTPTITTVYTVTKTNANCSDVKSLTVTVNNLPSVVGSAATGTSCSGKSFSIQAIGGSQYTLAPNNVTISSTGTMMINPTATTIYTLTATDGTCQNTNTFSVTVYPNPTISVVPSSSAICLNQSATLTLGGGVNYTWTNPGLSNSVEVVSPTSSTNYTITGDNIHTCTTSIQHVVIVHPLPVLNTTVTPTLVCVAQTATLRASGAHQYGWTNSSQIFSTTVNPLNTTNYVVTGTFTHTGCQNTKTVTVTVYQPTFAVLGSTSACAGGVITLTATGSSATSYTWNGNYQFPIFTSTTINTPTVFVVAVTSQTNNNQVLCTSSMSVPITIYTNPTITGAPQRTLICKGEEVELYGAGGNTYTWTAGPFTPNLFGSTVTVNPPNATNYTVNSTDINGCFGSTVVTVKISSCQGLEEAEALAKLLVYPNPSNGEFNIQTEGDVTLHLVSELGQELRVIELNSANNWKVTVSDIPSGIYFLTGKKDNTLIHQKLIVAH